MERVSDEDDGEGGRQWREWECEMIVMSCDNDGLNGYLNK